jgi:hypothetical protein
VPYASFIPKRTPDISRSVQDADDFCAVGHSPVEYYVPPVGKTAQFRCQLVTGTPEQRMSGQQSAMAFEPFYKPGSISWIIPGNEIADVHEIPLGAFGKAQTGHTSSGRKTSL